MSNFKKNNGNKSRGVTKELSDAISRTFEGMPVVEAERDLRIVLMPEDINKADRKSFDNCVFARACERQFGSTKIVLMRTRAYIAITDEKGNMRVERFVIPDEASEIIRNFDKGKKIKPGTAFHFKAPRESQTLEYERKKSKRQSRKAKMNNELRETNPQAEGQAKGVETRKNRPEGYNVKPKVADLDVRNGTGMIHTHKVD